MLRRDMSSTPPLGEALPRKNKFVGESFGVPNVRTIYAGAEEDRLNKDSRVVLLVGPSGSGKPSLIDFLCNYFYGATLEGNDRYHIANEKFDGSTPEKSIITYVFNDAYMEYRPIVIDTPATGTYHDEECSRLMDRWLQENSRMRIDLIGVVISCTVRMSTEEEAQLQKTLDLFPIRLRKNMAVFLTGSDGSPKPEALLRRFGLQDCKVFKVNTSCLFQAPLDDRLQEHLRGTYWRMTTGHFTDLTFQLRLLEPQTISGAPPEVSVSNSSRLSSGSSSINTIIQREPSGHRTYETKTSSVGGKTVTTSTTVDRARTTEEKTIVHPPVLKPLHPSVPPPPPPPPELPSGHRESGLPSSLLDDIRNRRRDSRDDVVVVEYELAQPEAVVFHNSPLPPMDSPPRDLPPPLSLSRPYDIPPSEFYKTVTTHASGTTTRFSSSSEFKEGTRVSVGAIGAPARYDEPPKTYAHETTPPLPEATTYSTVAYMNDNGTMTTDQMKTYVSRNTEGRMYSPYEKALETTPVILRTPATPRTPSLSQQLRYSFPDLERAANEEEGAFNRSQSTKQPKDPRGDVTRYVYDVGSRSHKSHVVGVRTSARSSARNSYDFEERKRESRSLETFTRAAENEAFYSASGFTVNRTPHRSMTSLHGLYENIPELVHSEDTYAFIDPATKLPIAQKPKQTPRTVTVINDPSPDVSFSRNDDRRKSIRTPPQHPQQQPFQPPVQTQTPVQTPGAPVPMRRKSQEKKTPDRRSGVYPPPENVDMRENPTYSLVGGVPLRDQPGRKGHGDQVSQELRDRERMLNETKNNVNRGSYPHPADRYQNIGTGAQPTSPPRQPENINRGSFQPDRYQNIGTGVQPTPPQRQQQPGSQNRNDIIIPPDMRNGRTPIEVTIGMKQKDNGNGGQMYDPYQNGHQQQNGKYAPPPQLPPHQYQDRDYGDDWDGQSSVTRRMEEQREQIHGRRVSKEQVQRRPPNLQIGEGAQANGLNNTNDPRSPAPPPYPNRQYPSTPDARGGQGAGGGDDSDAEQGLVVDHRRGLLKETTVKGYGHGKESYGYTQNGKRTKTITTKETTETKVTRRPGRRVKVLNWNPCSCGTTRDCLLNIICFIIAPLFVIAVIITIIVISITNK